MITALKGSGTSVIGVSNYIPTRIIGEVADFLSAGQIEGMAIDKVRALNQLIGFYKGTGIWNDIFYMNVAFGGTALSHSLNIKDVTRFAGTFNGAYTHSQSGFQPDAIANANFFAFGFDPANTADYPTEQTGHMFVYANAGTNPGSTAVALMGCNTESNGPVTQGRFQLAGSNAQVNGPMNTAAGVLQPNNTSTALTPRAWISSRFTTANSFIMRDGVVLSRFSTMGTTLLRQTGPLHINGRREPQGNRLPSNFRIAFVCIGAGLTEIYAKQCNDAVQQYQIQMGRQI
jgi:hypothetical protein